MPLTHATLLETMNAQTSRVLNPLICTLLPFGPPPTSHHTAGGISLHLAARSDSRPLEEWRIERNGGQFLELLSTSGSVAAEKAKDHL